MSRTLSLLTLIPTIFTFVAIILINIGGIRDLELESWQSDNEERNTQFDLLSWQFTVTPTQSITRYSYAVYLHRFCSGTPRGRVCRNVRASGGVLHNDQYHPNALIQQLVPFRFENVNFNIPFAFYILAAVAAACLVFLGPLGVLIKGRIVRIPGILCACAGALSMLIASSVLTFQTFRLRDQVREYTRRVATIRSSDGNSFDVYRISVPEVSMGKTVMALTWTATVLMLIQLGMWIVSLVMRNKEVDRMGKTEKYERSSV